MVTWWWFLKGIHQDHVTTSLKLGYTVQIAIHSPKYQWGFKPHQPILFCPKLLKNKAVDSRWKQFWLYQYQQEQEFGTITNLHNIWWVCLKIRYSRCSSFFHVQSSPTSGIFHPGFFGEMRSDAISYDRRDFTPARNAKAHEWAIDSIDSSQNIPGFDSEFGALLFYGVTW